MRAVDVKRAILSKNDSLARSLRSRFEEAGVFVSNLVSSPGSGKTALLERTLMELLQRGFKVAALAGDLQTENDARRLLRSGALVRQITTSGMCHLEASMVESHLQAWELDSLDFLFIENVGNLVCPSSYDLGEKLRIVLLSVTEGEDKPLKYPPIFVSSQVAVITKLDLAGPCHFDESELRNNIQAVHPGMDVLATSAHTGEGFQAWIDYLVTCRSGRAGLGS